MQARNTPSIMKPQLYHPISFLAVIALHCTVAAQEPPRRGIHNPQEPWAFRVVLDSRPRILVAAFDDSLWAAWDTQRCRLFQVWKPGDQGVRLQGAVFNGEHGPQPVSDGQRLHQEPAEPAWFVQDQGKGAPAVVRYRGHRTGTPGELHFSYEVILADGKTVISIEETPAFIGGTAPSLSRKFVIQGLPKGKQMALQLSGDASTWSLQGPAGELVDRNHQRFLIIQNNGKVTLTGTWKNL
jgi:cytochrome c